MIMKKLPKSDIPEHVRSIAMMVWNSWWVMFSAFILGVGDWRGGWRWREGAWGCGCIRCSNSGGGE